MYSKRVLKCISFTIKKRFQGLKNLIFKPNEKAYAYGDKLWTNCIVLNFFMTRDYI